MDRPVVAGLDGSRESVAAAHWAAREALRRGLPLRLLHAWEGLGNDDAALPELRAPLEWAKRLLRSAMDELDETYPQLRITADRVAQPAVAALLSAGAEAELLVLGSQGFGRVSGFLAGSVALATVARAECPVVLVRSGESAEDEHLPDGAARPSTRTPCREVVLAVHAGQSCDAVIRFAFESAARRAAPLRAVHYWYFPHAYGYAPGPMDGRARSQSQVNAEQALVTALKPWRERFPAVEVSESVENGRPAQQLIHAAEGAGLLVVGRRTRRGSIGAHTGPVAQAVMHQARCPVAVVPHD